MWEQRRPGWCGNWGSSLCQRETLPCKRDSAAPLAAAQAWAVDSRPARTDTAVGADRWSCTGVAHTAAGYTAVMDTVPVADKVQFAAPRDLCRVSARNYCRTWLQGCSACHNLRKSPGWEPWWQARRPVRAGEAVHN